MTDDELDRILAAAAPITDDRLDSLPLAEPAIRLQEAIVSNHPIPRPFPRRLAAVAAAAVLFVGIVGVVVAGGGGEERQAWAAELIEFAESSPQLLLRQPGWEVTRADQYHGEGEMSFGNEGREADLYWRAGAFEDWAADRAATASSVTTVQVLGIAAQVSQYEGANEFTALWPDEDRTIEFRMTADSQADFVEVLGTLQRVDLDTWLSAMPDSVVQSAGRAAVVNEMLADISLPAGFDVSALTSSTELKDRYQLGAEVTGAVGCAWVDEWARAKAAGDTVAAQAAVDAMAASHEWAILEEMINEGAWPQIFGIVADGLSTDGIVEGGIAVEEFAAGGIGCESGDAGD